MCIGVLEPCASLLWNDERTVKAAYMTLKNLENYLARRVLPRFFPCADHEPKQVLIIYCIKSVLKSASETAPAQNLLCHLGIIFDASYVADRAYSAS